MLEQKPDFVVAGGQHDGYVFLIASKTLLRIKLEEKFQPVGQMGYSPLDNFRFARPLDPQMALTAIFKDYVVIRAENYPEAWKALFEMWSPERGPHVVTHELSGQQEMCGGKGACALCDRAQKAIEG